MPFDFSKSPMRILHLTKYLPEFAGGIERVTRDMAAAGVAAGAHVEIVGAEPPTGENMVAEQDGILRQGLPVRWKIGTIPLAPGFLFLRKKILSADVIHVHFPNPLAEVAATIYLSTTFGKHRPQFVPVMHAPILRWPRLAGLWQSGLQSHLMKMADRIICPSPQHLGCLGEFGIDIDPAKVAVIPWAVEKAPRFETTTKPKTKTVKLLSIGRLVGYKGFHFLLDAVANLRGDWELTIVGRGPEKTHLESRIQQLGLAHRIHLVGWVSDERKHELLRECDVFLFPSQSVAESFGIAMGEAFAHGKPVVTTELSSGVAFLARGGECGAVVRTGLVMVLADAIQNLVDHPEKRLVAGRSNYDFWKRELTVETFERRYAEFLRSLPTHVEPRKIAA